MLTTLEPGAVIAGKYRVEELLGRGGMGAVYAATNDAIGRRVAIKVLVADLQGHAEAQRRFELEAQAAAVIGHPGIVDVLDMGLTEAGEPYIVMEQLEGLTLRQLLGAELRLTPGLAVAVMGPVLDALAAAHAAGVVHRDIKPANIFICSRPRATIKLLDFGVSRFSSVQGFTATGVTLGTPKYMAPEQVLGEKTVGPAADLFSVGAVLYRMLAGQAPLDGCADTASILIALHQPQAPLATSCPELPAELTTLVDALLERDMRARPDDAAELARQLRALAAPEDDALFAMLPAAPRLTSTPRPQLGRSRSRGSGQSQSPATRPAGPRARASTPVDHAPAATGRAPVIIAALVALAVVGAGAAYRFLRPTTTPQVVAPAPAIKVAPAPAEAATAQVVVEVVPPEARLWVDGVEQPCNPCTLTGPLGERVAVQAKADGYTPDKRRIEYGEARVRIELVATPAPRDAAKPGTRKRPLTLQENNPYR